MGLKPTTPQKLAGRTIEPTTCVPRPMVKKSAPTPAADPLLDAKPLHPYNLLFDDQWFLTVRRRQEHAAGFSVNALGFAGFLLQTQQSDRAWLEAQGAWSLLAAVASPAEIP